VAVFNKNPPPRGSVRVRSTGQCKFSNFLSGNSPGENISTRFSHVFGFFAPIMMLARLYSQRITVRFEAYKSELQSVPNREQEGRLLTLPVNPPLTFTVSLLRNDDITVCYSSMIIRPTEIVNKERQWPAIEAYSNNNPFGYLSRTGLRTWDRL